MTTGPAGADRRALPRQARIPPGAALAAALSAAYSAAFYWLFSDLDLNLHDEGFLWYGVLRALEGQVPLRDFQSYEPGRYYWCAAWSPLAGRGVLGLRASTAIFQGIGLFAGLLVARRVAFRAVWLIPIGWILVVWMFPRHKLFESSIAMMAVWVAVRLIESPSERNHLLAGVFAGAVACFGRNLALYVSLALLLLIPYLAWKRREPGVARRVALWSAGALAGSAPLWLMLALVPGFAASFVESVRFFLERGANLPIPYPWPWRADYQGLEGWKLLTASALTASFLLPVIAYPLGLVAALRTRPEQLAQRAVLIGATFVGIFYVHHVAIRSAPAHLAQCIHPALLVALALPATLRAARRSRAAVVIWGTLGVISTLAALESHPQLQHFAPGRKPTPFTRQRIAGEPLRLPQQKAEVLSRVLDAVTRHVPPDAALFVAPTLPTLYPVLGRSAPVWGIYFLWPAPLESQLALARDLEERGVDWALIVDMKIYGSREFLFRNTHPLVWTHLLQGWQRVATAELPPGYRLMRRRGDAARTRPSDPPGATRRAAPGR